MKLTVLAAGAWGTALAIAFSGRHNVTLWARETDVAAELLASGTNSRFLPGYTVPESVFVTTDLPHAIEGAELIVVATPIIGLRPTITELKRCGSTAPLLWVCKGFEAGSGRLPHQVVSEIYGPDTPDGFAYGVLSGPSFAEEVASAQPTAVALAGSTLDFARHAARELHTSRLRLYANDDLVGTEVGGAVKNVLAIATGVCDGLGFGLNARAALMTRGLAEIARLGIALGARRETFMGLAGMGDLILTCTGDLSRNRRVGLGLAQGKPLSQILVELGHVAEGVPTAQEVDQLATRLNVDMPISRAVAAVLAGRLGAAEAVEQLLSRDPREEMA